jgi:hypothetical protein
MLPETTIQESSPPRHGFADALFTSFCLNIIALTCCLPFLAFEKGKVTFLIDSSNLPYSEFVAQHRDHNEARKISCSEMARDRDVDQSAIFTIDRRQGESATIHQHQSSLFRDCAADLVRVQISIL